MDKYSTFVFNILTNRFPNFKQTNSQVAEHFELDIPSLYDTAIGGLVIQITVDKTIWLRNYQPYSAYSVDTPEELVFIIEGILEDKILWAIGFKGDIWFETTLFNRLDNLEKEKGITYQILSWTGSLDTTIQVD